MFPYQDKQEIKTVRIVKRESERRQRDKDKMGPLIGSNIFDHISELQSPDELNEYLSTYQAEPRISYFNTDELLTSGDQLDISRSTTKVPYNNHPNNSRVESVLKNISIDFNTNNKNNSSAASHSRIDNVHDIFQSNTARQILNELSSSSNTSERQRDIDRQQLNEMAKQYKRNVPRKKKRHNTAPNNDMFNDLAERNTSKNVSFFFI